MRFMKRIKTLTLAIVLVANLQFDQSQAQPTQKIINGNNVGKPLPYMAALYSSTSFSDTFFCGGSLIAPGWVLTAAHCAELVTNDTIVGIGGLKVGKPRKISPVESVYFDDWNNTTLTRDWALLKLKRKLTVKTYPKLARKNRTGLHKAFGWGTVDPFNILIPDRLQVIVIPLWSQSECLLSLGETFHSSVMICGGVLSTSYEELDGKDTCNGDSGGPVTNLSGSVIYGLTSWGYECAGVETPGVYASVSVARKWILKTIKKFS